MTDLAPQIYNAFCEVFSFQPKWLYCTWHVDKAWKEELKKKVRNLEIEAVVYKMLRTVLEETNEILFQDKLSSLIDRLESHATREFKAYFLKYWICVTKSWAYCYRVGEGINTNMFVEAFHRTFNYNYLKGKYNKRVDTVLVNLFKFSRDKLFSRLIKLTKGSLTQRMQNIYDRHLSSKKMNYTAINKTSDENVFLINSDDGQNKYVATKLSDKCNIVGCQLQCIMCFVCTHTFHCNCPDFLIKNTSCKHVHLLKEFLAADNKIDEKPKCSLELQDVYSYKEVNSIKCNLAKLKEISNFEETKSKTEKLLHNLMHRVKNCSNLDMEALKYVEKQVSNEPY
ncbi:uncharacterized protein LOC136095554 [Hydra vulgaris]|uniref:uncharacterized protein LOC136095554 n=1 Tax=Hydra vulgaris TaxID=6087 RepID=UPI0032EA8BBA